MTGMLMNTESSSRRVPGDAGATLWGLLSANYASFRIYDFTMMTPQGAAVPSEMPLSASGATGDYIRDAIIVPHVVDTIEARTAFNTDIALTVGTPLAITSIPDTAFRTTPGGQAFTVAFTPASSSIDGLTWNYATDTENLNLIASKAGVYTLTITGILTSNPTSVAAQTLTITAT